MKKTFKAIAFGIALTAGSAMFVTGCTGSATGNGITLDNEGDSLSYAVSIMLAEDLPARMAEEGIDSTTIDDFLRGMRLAFPTEDTAESRAFISGIYAAIEAAGMLEQVDKSIYPDEMGKKSNRKLFLEGLVASATGDKSVLGSAEARAYYNQQVFRARSEKFIADNTKRPGVKTLPSGVQYKIAAMGEGAVADNAEKVKCIYKGTFPNGAAFSSSRGEAVEFDAGELVPGLAEILTTLPAGTRCMAYIPWELGYGAKGYNNIPPFSALVYDIEIVGTK